MKLQPTAALLVLTFCALAANRAAAQAVRYVSQERSARSFLYERYEPYGEDPADVIRESAFVAAHDFGDFSVDALAEPDMEHHRTGISRITQESRLAPGGIFISGFSEAYTTSDTGYFEFETITAATFD